MNYLKVSSLLSFVLLSNIFIYSQTLQSLELINGYNEFSIVVQNNTNIAFDSVYVVTEPDNLPEIVKSLYCTNSINSSAGKRSSSNIGISIYVDNLQDDLIYTIPLVLKDRNNNKWNYSIDAILENDDAKKNRLLKNYPNPFNASTDIGFELTNKNEINTKLVIYNLVGKKIFTLIDQDLSEGFYNYTWQGFDNNGKTVSSGTYIYKLTSGSFSQTKKMILLK